MVLEMYLNKKLVESQLLSLHKIGDDKEREPYVQGAVKLLLEKWEDLIKDQNLQVDFFIRPTISRS